MSEYGWLAGPLAYERVPERFNMVTVLLDRHLAEGRGDRTAIVTPDRTLTYADVAGGVARAASALRRLDLGAEARVAMLLPDSPEFVFAFLGAQRAGLVPVPLSTLGSADDVAYALADSRAAALVVHASLLDRAEAARHAVGGTWHRLVVGADVPPGAVRFETALEAEAAAFEPAPTHRDDMAYWLYSSGTTGRPKAVVHLHHDMLFCIAPFAEHVLGLRPDDRLFSVPRLFFSYGLGSCVYLPFWAGASTLLVAERPDPGRILALCARHRPTIHFTVPTALATLVREGRVPSPDLASLRLVVSAGEPLPAPLYREWVSRTGVECLDGLGATEVGYIYISNRPGAVRPGATGQLLPGYRARLVGDDGREVPAGAVGELWLAGDSVAAGYWNKPAQTASAFAGEWYRTGDRFVRDADGWYVYQGRADELIRVSGYWVSPLEVEAALAEHPAIVECAVVGRADAEGLVRPHAFVVARPGAPLHGLEAELQALARARLPSFKVPRWITVVDALPRTATGKLQRHRLGV